MYKNILFIVCCLPIFVGCSEQKNAQKEVPAAMKCGVGKCGASLADSSSTLAKKKNNILNQMREDDPRKNCVLEAKTTKELYDCVRSPITNRLTKKCGNISKEKSTMKCETGKCV